MEGLDIPGVTKKTYRVTGPTAFRDHAPGEEFTAALDPDQEARALARGSLKVVTKAASGKESKGE